MPTQMKRIARAEAETALIAAQAQIEINDLQRRAALRWVAEETRKQVNIEAITEKAIEQLDDGADPSNIEDDWIANFFEKSKIVSDEEMQKIWAQVLAQEANHPGKFSKRAVNIIAELSKRDAEAFTSLCRFILPQLGEALIFNENDHIYNNNGVSFGTITELESIGLVNYAGLGSFSRNAITRKILATYFNSPIIFELDDGVTSMPIGKVIFTTAGRELSHIIKTNPVPEFLNYVLNYYQQQAGISAKPPKVQITVPAGAAPGAA
ncbi:Protein of unknown function [Dyella marensis]|uniref:TIGR03899 family protein n=2 Tax=Rhodanobacteraceae TaxID=1775411 RepID=A0A1I2EDW1_9GAMM|nr:Protein of unknown function [Dyella marensis]